MAKCTASRCGGWGNWRTGEKPKTYLTLDGLLPGKTGGFFSLLLFPARPLPERKWTRQMASAGRNFCAQRSNFTSSCLLSSVYRVTSIWVLLMWEMATQEFKFRNYFRTFGVAHVKPADEKGSSVDKK